MTKYKTIKVSESLHKKLKKFCAKHGLKLNEWCERWLENQMTVSERDFDWEKAPKGDGSQGPVPMGG